jgi:pyrophosphatase PpaX
MRGILKEYNWYLFDADGTLFDTTKLICACFMNTAKITEGRELDPAKVLSNIGMTLRDQMEEHFGKLTDEEFARRRAIHMEYQMSIYKEYLRAFNGVADGLQQLVELGKHCAVVTSRMMPSIQIFLEHTGLSGFFDHLVTPELTKKHKPHPDPVLKALELMHAVPEQTIFIGDATFDIECGHSAGIDTAFVGWSCNDISSLMAKPTWVINDMSELLQV